jgi:hypothetical protein
MTGRASAADLRKWLRSPHELALVRDRQDMGFSPRESRSRRPQHLHIADEATRGAQRSANYYTDHDRLFLDADKGRRIFPESKNLSRPFMQIAADSTIVSGHWLSPQTDDPLTRKSRPVSSPL